MIFRESSGQERHVSGVRLREIGDETNECEFASCGLRFEIGRGACHWSALEAGLTVASKVDEFQNTTVELPATNSLLLT
jgi:hypothetical protein